MHCLTFKTPLYCARFKYYAMSDVGQLICPEFVERECPLRVEIVRSVQYDYTQTQWALLKGRKRCIADLALAILDLKGRLFDCSTTEESTDILVDFWHGRSRLLILLMLSDEHKVRIRLQDDVTVELTVFEPPEHDFSSITTYLQ
jgi:hypothetical protein